MFAFFVRLGFAISWLSPALAGPVDMRAAPRFNRTACQLPSVNPLKGCPAGTLLVGPSGKYKTIQSAVAALPNNTLPAVILIQAGNYTEQVNVTRAAPVYLLGQTSNARSQYENRVNIIWRAVARTGDNAFTATLTVAPNLDADLTGSGPTGFAIPPDTPFGNTDFRAYNLNLINDFVPYSDGPSLTLSMGYANAGFYQCQFLSYQDTTDFFYGFGTLWVQSCDIRLRSCGGGITAWKGTNTTFENKYGIYIADSNIRAANSSLNIVGKCALGRPWNAQHRSTSSNTYLDNSIDPAGYIRWLATDPSVNSYTFMAEYKDFGSGLNLTGREAAANVTKELTDAQFAPYSTPKKVFQYQNGTFGNTVWIDRSA